jgi:hypothetical protein
VEFYAINFYKFAGRPHTCFNCAEKGHKVDDCPMRRRGPRPGYKGFVFPPREVREKRGGRVVGFEEQFPEMMEGNKYH